MVITLDLDGGYGGGIMPDRSPSRQTPEGQHDKPMPIGIPLAAGIAVLFLFGSTSSILARKALMWPLRG
jgi:hypothetical protein